MSKTLKFGKINKQYDYTHSYELPKNSNVDNLGLLFF